MKTKLFLIILVLTSTFSFAQTKVADKFFENCRLVKSIPFLKQISQNTPAEAIQTRIYTVGKENGYEKNLRDWFKLIYEVCFGEENGPRMGFFISFFGVKETIDLMEKKLNI